MLCAWVGIIYLSVMFSLVKKVVAGPKNCTIYEGEELDLTYISQRIIAMAYPASDLLEKTYRNSIKDVVGYFHNHHRNNYLIINVSSRPYDYTLFDNRVKEYQWADHQTPTFTTLVEVSYDIYKFLREVKNRVAAVHCNHGKGRTGTAIIAFMLLIGYYESARECLKFYNSKRFNKETYGVDQPCQLRYLRYMEEIMNTPKISQRLVCYRLKGITHRGLGEGYYVNIRNTRNQQLVHEQLRFQKHPKHDKLLLADIFIELFQETWSGEKKVARANQNLYFLNGETKLKLRGQNLKVSGGHSQQFQFTLHFEYYCLCHLPQYEGSVCHCRRQRTIQQKYWGQMIQKVKQCKSISKNWSYYLMHGMTCSTKQPANKLVRNQREQNDYMKLHRSFDGKSKSFRKQKLHALIKSKMMKKCTFQENIHPKEEIGEFDQTEQEVVVANWCQEVPEIVILPPPLEKSEK